MLSIEKVSREEVNPNMGRRMDAMLDFAEERGLEKTFVGYVTCPYTWRTSFSLRTPRIKRFVEECGILHKNTDQGDVYSLLSVYGVHTDSSEGTIYSFTVYNQL